MRRRERSRNGGRLRELVLGHGVDPAGAALVHREALRVLRPVVDAAHFDAYSGDVWPPEVLASYERALLMAREEVVAGTRSRRADPGMGIDVDVRDEAEFEVLSALSPCTIHAEAWSEGCLVFSAGDTGTSLWMALTQAQEAELRVQLGVLGVPDSALVPA